MRLRIIFLRLAAYANCVVQDRVLVVSASDLHVALITFLITALASEDLLS